MFENRDILQRIFIICVAAVIVICMFFVMLIKMSDNREETKQTRISACQTITDESTRDDCLGGQALYYKDHQDGRYGR